MADVSFDPAIILDSRENSGSTGKVAAIQNKVFALWRQQSIDPAADEASSGKERQSPIQEAQWKIMYCISKDSGTSFADARTLYESEGANLGLWPLVATSFTNQRIFALWSDEDKSGRLKLYLTKSNNDYSGFEKPTILNRMDNSHEMSNPAPKEVENNHRPVVSAIDKRPWRSSFGPEEMRHIDAKLAVEGENVYVFWYEAQWHRSTTNSTDYQVYFRASNDGGETFGKIFEFTRFAITPGQDDLMRMFHIKLAASGTDVYAMWCQFTPVPGQMPGREPKRVQAYLAVSKDAGRNFGKTIDLDNQTTVCQGDIVPEMAEPNEVGGKRIPFYEKMPFEIAAGRGGILYMLLIGHHRFNIAQSMMESMMDMLNQRAMSGSDANGNTSFSPASIKMDIQLPLYLAKSRDYGLTYSEALQISDCSAGIDDTYMTKSSPESQESIHIMWRVRDGSFFIRGSTDGGMSFYPAVQIKEARIYGSPFHPFYSAKLLGWEGKPCMAFVKQVGPARSNGAWMETFFTIGQDSATSLADPTRLSARDLDQASVQSGFPDFTIAGGNIYVIWSEVIDKKYSIRFAKGRLS